MFPTIKKCISKFVSEDAGRITKRAILLLGINVALLSATAGKVAAWTDRTPPTDDTFHTTEARSCTEDCGDTLVCEPETPDGATVEVTEVHCVGGSDVCHNSTGSAHDSAYAQMKANIKVKTNTFLFEKAVVCRTGEDHDSGGSGHVSASGSCKVTVGPFSTHTNTLTLENNAESITAKHEHSITDSQTATICLGRKATGWYYEGDRCHSSC